MRLMSLNNCCVIIPTYNNQQTLLQVIDDVRKYTHCIIVVNDGSTDSTSNLLKDLDHKTQVISYKTNKGKGYALKTGFKKAIELGFTHAITLDSDGQHLAKDIPYFIQKIDTSPNSMIIGARKIRANQPKKSSFANKFSNFWFNLQTLKNITDTQSGFRAYPLEKIKKTTILSNRYEAELEIIVRLAWKGVKVESLPIDVYYPPIEERVSHFRPDIDFIRISIVNTCLIILAFAYGYPSMLWHKIIDK